MDERIHTADNVRRWFILRHPKPEMLNDILSGRKKVFLSADDDAAALPPFEHYIPFADMAYRPSKAEVDPDNYKPYNPILDGEALRADLHSFVFLKVTPRQMEAILQSEWYRCDQRLLCGRVFADARIRCSDYESGKRDLISVRNCRLSHPELSVSCSRRSL